MSAAPDTILLAQAEERLRQERELFDQMKAQDQNSFRQRQAIGWVVVVLFVAICAFSGFVLVDHSDFSDGTVTLAASALLVESLGLVGALLRGTMGVAPRRLEPTTARPDTQTAS